MPLVTKNWRWKETMKPSSCAKGSIRTIVREQKRGVNTLLVRVCCPRGKYAGNAKRGNCRGGMKTLAIGKRRTKV